MSRFTLMLNRAVIRIGSKFWCDIAWPTGLQRTNDWMSRGNGWRLCCFLLLLLHAPPILAQPLAPATFFEQIRGGSVCDNFVDGGASDALPEGIGDIISGACSLGPSTYSVGMDAITAAGTGPGPQVTPPLARVDGSATAGGMNIAVGGDAIASVSYEVRITEAVSPPGSGQLVPIDITSIGFAEISGSGATATAVLSTSGGLVFNSSAFASSTFGPTTDGFNVSRTFNLSPGTRFRVALRSEGQISLSTPTAGGFTAFVDPVIEIADVLFPGTNQSFREFYTVEFSPGIIPEPGSISVLAFSFLFWLHSRRGVL